jgi:hypothetical protein
VQIVRITADDVSEGSSPPPLTGPTLNTRAISRSGNHRGVFALAKGTINALHDDAVNITAL